MSRYSARIRTLEARLAPGACPRCSVVCAVDFYTLPPGAVLPPAPLCERCGRPHKLFVVEIDTQQPVPAALDNERAAVVNSKALIRRRRYYVPT